MTVDGITDQKTKESKQSRSAWKIREDERVAEVTRCVVDYRM